MVTAPFAKIPAELKDEAVVVEFPLPQAVELQAVLQRLTQTPGVKGNLTRLGQEKLVQVALGFTASQASVQHDPYLDAGKTAFYFVVVTANNIFSLLSELLRKRRFDEIFFLDLPTVTEHQEIFTVHLRKRQRFPQDFDITLLAQESEGYVGAEIEQAIIDVMYIGFNASREFTTADISVALKRQVPLSVSQQETTGALRSWLREGRANQRHSKRFGKLCSKFVPLQLGITR